MPTGQKSACTVNPNGCLTFYCWVPPRARWWFLVSGLHVRKGFCKERGLQCAHQSDRGVLGEGWCLTREAYWCQGTCSGHTSLLLTALDSLKTSASPVVAMLSTGVWWIGKCTCVVNLSLSACLREHKFVCHACLLIFVHTFTLATSVWLLQMCCCTAISLCFAWCNLSNSCVHKYTYIIYIIYAKYSLYIYLCMYLKYLPW